MDDLKKETIDVIMTTLRQEKEFTTYPLDSDTDYTIEEIENIANDFITGHNDRNTNKEFNIVKYKLRSFTEHDYGDSYNRFEIVGYRLETTKELEKRLKLEKAQEDLEIKQKAEDEKKEIEKRIKQEKLNSDPDYQKFLELQKKFK